MLKAATSVLIVFVALLPASASAQQRVRLIVPAARQMARAPGAEAMPASARLAQAQPAARKDSLTNGAIIGVIAGAAAMGTFGWLLTRTDAACGCGGDILKAAALGAGIGAGVGLGVDALFDRRSFPVPTARPGVRLAITF